MRGQVSSQQPLWSAIDIESLTEADHPLREFKCRADQVLSAMESEFRSDDGDPGNPTVNFRGEKRSNATHQPITGPQARLYRKAAGQQSRLCHSAHALMENRNGLLVDVSVAEANGYAEREEALRMVRRTRERDATNAAPKPFVWTKTADEIFSSISRFCARISDSGH